MPYSQPLSHSSSDSSPLVGSQTHGSQRIHPEQVESVWTLWRAGLAQTEIAASVGIHRNSVGRLLRGVLTMRA